MNGRRRGIGIGTGGVSVLAVFVVLCLTVLASLSLVTAHADLRLAQKTAQAAQEYYETDAAAEREVAQIVEETAGSAAWRETLAGRGYDVNGELVSFSRPVGDSRVLYVEVSLRLDDAGVPTGEFARTRWQTQPAEKQRQQETLNVLK